MVLTKYGKRHRGLPQALLLAVLIAQPTLSNAQGRPAAPLSASEQLQGLYDTGTPPELIADAIVDFVPYTNMPLHIPYPAERALQGRIAKLERGPSDIPAIVHPAHAIIGPLEAGVAVKLFLKRYPGRAEYYVIAVFPTSYTYKGQP